MRGKSVGNRLHEKTFVNYLFFVTPLYKMRLAGWKTRFVTQTHDNHVSGDTVASSEQVGSLLLCLLQSATFGAGATGSRIWGPTLPPLLSPLLFPPPHPDNFCTLNFLDKLLVLRQEFHIIYYRVTAYRLPFLWSYFS